MIIKTMVLNCCFVLLAMYSVQAQRFSMASVQHFENIEEAKNELKSLASEKQFSGTVLISKDDNIILKEAYGMADIERQIANKIDTKINIGSINKVFTQVCVMQLFDNNRIKLEDNIVKYIPELKMEMAEEITILHLLKMTSGLGGYFDSDMYVSGYQSFQNLEDYLPVLLGLKLDSKPGTRPQYSNAGYELLGIMIQRVSGQNYYDYVKKNVYEKAGMINTDAYNRNKKTKNLAHGYSQYEENESMGQLSDNQNGKFVLNVNERYPKGSAAGGGYSTVEDLSKFAISLNQDNLLTQSSKDIFFNKLNRQMPDGNIRLMVAGGAPGINAMLIVNYTKNSVVVVLSNFDPPTATGVGARLAKSVEMNKI